MSLWNPFASDPLGNPVLALAPGALRVADGQATAEQLGAARATFARFCAGARLSAAPNPSEIGRLPDGTPYRITVVGPVSTMTIWPGGRGAAGMGSGIGIPVMLSEKRYLFLLTYRNDAWEVSTPKSFFGGGGVWVSSKDPTYYLSYQRQGDPATLYWPAHNADDKSTPEITPGMTAGSGGLANAVGTSTAGLLPVRGGMVSNGVYIQPTPVFSDESFGIHSGAAASKAAIQKTPMQPAAQTSRFQPAPLKLPPHLVLRERIEDTHSIYMLRDGSRMAIPVMNKNCYLDELFYNRRSNTPYVTSEYALTHEASARLSDGNANILLAEINDATFDSILTPNDLRTSRWHYTYTDTRGEPEFQGEKNWYGSSEIIPESLRDGSIGLGSIIIHIPRKEERIFQRSRNASGVVYSGYDWKDGRVDFRLEVSDECYLKYAYNTHPTVELVLKNFWYGTNVLVTPAGFGAKGTLEVEHLSSNPPGPGEEVQPELQWVWAQYMYGSQGVDGSPTDRFMTHLDQPSTGLTFSGEMKFATLSKVKTPWGDLALTDIDWVMHSDIYEGQYRLTADVGYSIRRLITFIDPAAGIVAYSECALTDIRTEGGTLSAVFEFEESYSFVILHMGQEIFRSPIRNTRTSQETVRNYMASPFAGTFYSLKVEQSTDVNLSGAGTWKYRYATDAIKWTLAYSRGKVEEAMFSMIDMISGDQTDFVPAILTYTPESNTGFTLTTTVDPGSGAHVLLVTNSMNLKLVDAWAIAPDGGRTKLSELLGSHENGPFSTGARIESVVSV